MRIALASLISAFAWCPTDELPVQVQEENVHDCTILLQGSQDLLRRGASSTPLEVGEKADAVTDRRGQTSQLQSASRTQAVPQAAEQGVLQEAMKAVSGSRNQTSQNQSASTTQIVSDALQDVLQEALKAVPQGGAVSSSVNQTSQNQNVPTTPTVLEILQYVLQAASKALSHRLAVSASANQTSQHQSASTTPRVLEVLQDALQAATKAVSQGLADSAKQTSQNQSASTTQTLLHVVQAVLQAVLKAVPQEEAVSDSGNQTSQNQSFSTTPTPLDVLQIVLQAVSKAVSKELALSASANQTSQHQNTSIMQAVLQDVVQEVLQEVLQGDAATASANQTLTTPKSAIQSGEFNSVYITIGLILLTMLILTLLKYCSNTGCVKFIPFFHCVGFGLSLTGGVCFVVGERVVEDTFIQMKKQGSDVDFSSLINLILASFLFMLVVNVLLVAYGLVGRGSIRDFIFGSADHWFLQWIMARGFIIVFRSVVWLIILVHGMFSYVCFLVFILVEILDATCGSSQGSLETLNILLASSGQGAMNSEAILTYCSASNDTTAAAFLAWLGCLFSLIGQIVMLSALATEQERIAIQMKHTWHDSSSDED